MLRMLLAVMLLTIAGPCFMLVQSNASDRSGQYRDAEPSVVGQGAPKQVSPEAQDDRQVIAAYGDTIWSIARQYKPANADLRRYVYQMLQRNDLMHAELQAGQVVRIPE